MTHSNQRLADAVANVLARQLAHEDAPTNDTRLALDVALDSHARTLVEEARAILDGWNDVQITRQGSAWVIGGSYPLNRLQPNKPYAGMREHDAPRDPSLLDWAEADDDGSTGVIGLAWDLRAAAEKDAVKASDFLDAMFAPPQEATEPEATEAAPKPMPPRNTLRIDAAAVGPSLVPRQQTRRDGVAHPPSQA